MKTVVRSSARRAAKAVDNLQSRLTLAVINAEAQNLERAEAELVQASSGSISTKTLAAMGHPFAKRDPQTPLDPAVINDQGHGFPQGWMAEGPRVEGTRIVSRVVNRHPDAKWIRASVRPGWGGTMVARPIVPAVLEKIRARRLARLVAAIRSAYTGFSR